MDLPQKSNKIADLQQQGIFKRDAKNPKKLYSVRHRILKSRGASTLFILGYFWKGIWCNHYGPLIL